MLTDHTGSLNGPSGLFLGKDKLWVLSLGSPFKAGFGIIVSICRAPSYSLGGCLGSANCRVRGRSSADCAPLPTSHIGVLRPQLYKYSLLKYEIN